MVFGKRIALLLVVSLASIGVDQLTKKWANETLATAQQESYLGDTFRLTYAKNTGAFLSLGSTLPDGARYWVLTVLVGLLLLGIVVFSVVNKQLDAWHVAGYGFIAGGGLSNWVDRARNGGAVVDFMNMGIGRLRTGIFNVADLAILLGIGLILVAGWKKGPATPNVQTTV